MLPWFRGSRFQRKAAPVLDATKGVPSWSAQNDTAGPSRTPTSRFRRGWARFRSEQLDQLGSELFADGVDGNYDKMFDPDCILEALWHAASRADAENEEAARKEPGSRRRGRTLDAELDCNMLFDLARTARGVLLNDPTLLELDAPIKICGGPPTIASQSQIMLRFYLPSPITPGDIHGQFKDLLRMFAEAGKPPEHKWVLGLALAGLQIALCHIDDFALAP